MTSATSVDTSRSVSARVDQHLRVDRIDRAAENVLLLRLVAPDQAVLPKWSPGDHLELVLPSKRIRHYSLCGPTDDRTSYTVAVLRVADGRGGSIEIHDGDLLGSDLVVRGPRTNFPLVEASSYLLLAGGIGITPLAAMARALHARGADWSLIYGARSEAAMAFRSELAGLTPDGSTSSPRTRRAFPIWPGSSTRRRPGRRSIAVGLRA